MQAGKHQFWEFKLLVGVVTEMFLGGRDGIVRVEDILKMFKGQEVLCER